MHLKLLCFLRCEWSITRLSPDLKGLLQIPHSVAVLRNFLCFELISIGYDFSRILAILCDSILTILRKWDATSSSVSFSFMYTRSHTTLCSSVFTIMKL